MRDDAVLGRALPLDRGLGPIRRSLLEYCHAIWYGKTRMVWLPDGEKILKIRL